MILTGIGTANFDTRSNGRSAGLDKPAVVDASDTRPTVDELIEEMVNGAINKIGKPVIMMDKVEKLQIVSELLRRGVFVIKGSVERVANSLSVTRFAVYNYLEELGYAGGAKAASLEITRNLAKRSSKKNDADQGRAPPACGRERQEVNTLQKSSKSLEADGGRRC